MWLAINLLFVVICVWAGYVAMGPESLHGINPDPFFCLATFLIAAAFPVVYLKLANPRRLTRPSLVRRPFGWGDDPLQMFFISTIDSFALFFGSAIRMASSSVVGRWLSLFFLGIGVGFAVGQFIVYAIYKDRIVQ